jgi:hypothetical protein
MYSEISVIVDGAEEEFETFGDEILLQEFIAEIERDQRGHGYRVEVYRYDHDHAIPPGDEECACRQYDTDHHPYRVFDSLNERRDTFGNYETDQDTDGFGHVFSDADPGL